MISFLFKPLRHSTPVRSGDVSDEAASRFLNLVYRYVSRRLSRREEIEDVTAEILHQAVVQFPRFRGEGSFEAWLYRISQRTLAGFLRRTRRRRHAEVSVLLPEQEEELPGDPADDPAMVALRRERARKAREILEALPEDHREVLLLKYAEGLTQEEIGRVMGRSAAAVNSLLQRARRAARQQGERYFLGDDEPEVGR